jgi:hypothetical protein
MRELPAGCKPVGDNMDEPSMKLDELPGAKFRLGKIVLTDEVTVAATPLEVIEALYRHVTGDWGEVSEKTRRENELSLKEGFRLKSAYAAIDGTEFWVITEHDRSETTVLLAEY